MKKVKIKSISFILIVAILFSAVACKNKGKDTLKDEPLIEYSDEVILKDSKVDLVANNTSNYVIVYPRETNAMIVSAVKELTLFFKEATGIELISITDLEYELESYDNEFISIGNTQMFNNSGINYNPIELGQSGYLIKLIGKNLFIYGGYYGNLFGVYEFLSKQFNFEVYAEDEIYIDTVTDSAKMKEFDLTDIPDADLRIGGNGDIAGYSGSEHMYRMREMTFSDVYVGGWGEGNIPPFHNSMEYITKSEFQGEHPNWFSPSGAQLCLTRDPEGLLDALIPKMIEQLDKYPTRNIITFTQMDGPTWCTCDSCKYKGQVEEETEALSMSATAEKEYYCAQNIRFVNRLAKRLSEEYTVENGYENGRNIYVYLFSYGMTNACPVKYDGNGNPVKDSNGNYVIFDENLQIADNLGVLFCYSFSTTYTGEYNDLTKSVKDKVDRWKTISKRFSFWSYSTNFVDYFAPYDSVQQLQDNVQFAVKSGAQVYYNMAQYDMKTPNDFGKLESYLQSKLSWNSKANVGKLINKFFDNYYKDASDSMKKLYSEYTTHMAYLATEKNIGHTINTASSLVNKNNWSYKLLNDYLGVIDEAYNSIEKYKNKDKELYQKLYDRINLESFTFRYLLYKLYPDKFDYDDLLNLQTKLITECRNIGVTYCKEGSDISGLF